MQTEHNFAETFPQTDAFLGNESACFTPVLSDCSLQCWLAAITLPAHFIHLFPLSPPSGPISFSIILSPPPFCSSKMTLQPGVSDTRTLKSIDCAVLCLCTATPLCCCLFWCLLLVLFKSSPTFSLPWSMVQGSFLPAVSGYLVLFMSR